MTISQILYNYRNTVFVIFNVRNAYLKRVYLKSTVKPGKRRYVFHEVRFNVTNFILAHLCLVDLSKHIYIFS